MDNLAKATATGGVREEGKMRMFLVMCFLFLLLILSDMSGWFRRGWLTTQGLSLVDRTIAFAFVSVKSLVKPET